MGIKTNKQGGNALDQAADQVQYLVLTGTINIGNGKSIGAGSDVSRIKLPDDQYGIKAPDVQRIVDAGAGYLVDADSAE